MINKYDLRVGFKTRFFNFFRHIIMVWPIEKLARITIQKFNPALLLKIIPPNYLYNNPTYRMVNNNGIIMRLLQNSLPELN